MSWGYPAGRQYRNYFVQRCFEFNRAVHEYLSSNQTIKCNKCGRCYPLEQKASLELYKWRCPECAEGQCSVVNLSDDFKEEVEKLNREIMLDPVEIERERQRLVNKFSKIKKKGGGNYTDADIQEMLDKFIERKKADLAPKSKKKRKKNMGSPCGIS